MEWTVTLVNPESKEVIGGKRITIKGSPVNPRYEAQKMFLEELTKNTPYEGIPISKVITYIKAKVDEDGRVKQLPNNFVIEDFFNATKPKGKTGIKLVK